VRWAAAALRGFQDLVLVYFALLNLLCAFFCWRGLRGIVLYARELSATALRDLLGRESYKPVSILVPAYNEEASIVASVSSFLGLHYPELEVIVVADGPTDGTVARLVEAFALSEEPRLAHRVVASNPVRRVFRSLRWPNLVVVEKENGGKADALNAALNYARFPVVCSVDADSLLDVQALLRASRLFSVDERIVAVGGTIRLLNGSLVRDGHLVELRLPGRWVERFQVLEYARAFFTGRAGWSATGALLIVSGAFGLFRREAVVAVGGYRVGTVGEDMDLVVRLHRHFHDLGAPYRIVASPDPICWTEAPHDLATLRRQRNRWQRGLLETLWMHRDVCFNPRYGRIGLWAMPYFWFFEGLAPLIEATGWILFPVSVVFGAVYWRFAAMFLVLAVLYGMVLSQLAVGIETLLLARYPRIRDRLLLAAAAFLEFFGYRQILTFERLVATFQIRSLSGSWGAMRRQGIPRAGIVVSSAAVDPPP
jgi:cellulose synthase/poly-beta-1,6-N-acetylglucosamine synthase-like glycosyltransferase